MEDDLLVLGIDPGTAITGYGVVRSDGQTLDPVSYGVITTPAGVPLALRLQRLYRELRTLMSTYQPTQAAVEDLFFSRNARSALSVAHARGVILLAAADAGLSVYSYTPLEVKKAVTGYGLASKEQIQQMVRLLLSLETSPRPDDAADALAVAICHAHSFSTAVRLSDGNALAGWES